MFKQIIQKKILIANILLISGFLIFLGARGYARQVILSVPTHPDGTLVKTADSGRVFVLEFETKRYIPSPQVFESRYRWQDIVTISETEMKSYQEGDPIFFRDGTLISDDNAVYVIENGFKRPFVSPLAFETRGYKWSNVKKVKEKDILQMHPTGSVVFADSRRTNGDLIKTANNPNLYVLENNRKRLIPSPLVFDARYRWNDVVTISEAEMKIYPVGDTVPFPDGMLVRDDNTVYVIEFEMKRPIAHLNDFKDLGYKGSNVVWPADYKFVLGLYPIGDIISFEDEE